MIYCARWLVAGALLALASFTGSQRLQTLDAATPEAHVWRLGPAAPVGASQHPDPKRYPHEGDIYYDGASYADSYFLWHNAGGWSDLLYGGFELDLSFDTEYFDTCTSWNNMPDPYDDCPTAGSVEPSGVERVFSVGDYQPRYNIQSNVWYMAKWDFSGGWGSSAYPKIGWQETNRTLCGWKSPECYDGVEGTVLKDLYWRYGTSSTDNWYY